MNGLSRYPWKRYYVLKEHIPNKPGMYVYYDQNGKVIYVGHASRLRHRVQSYYQKDDFKAHPTKNGLRRHIKSYAYIVMPEKKARAIEKKIKHKAKFNYK